MICVPVSHDHNWYFLVNQLLDVYLIINNCQHKTNAGHTYLMLWRTYLMQGEQHHVSVNNVMVVMAVMTVVKFMTVMIVFFYF